MELPDAVKLVALNSARVLSKYGVDHADWQEWRDLNNSLLELQPFLDKITAGKVGKACSTFINEEK